MIQRLKEVIQSPKELLTTEEHAMILGHEITRLGCSLVIKTFWRLNPSLRHQSNSPYIND